MHSTLFNTEGGYHHSIHSILLPPLECILDTREDDGSYVSTFWVFTACRSCGTPPWITISFACLDTWGWGFLLDYTWRWDCSASGNLLQVGHCCVPASAITAVTLPFCISACTAFSILAISTACRAIPNHRAVRHLLPWVFLQMWVIFLVHRHRRSPPCRVPQDAVYRTRFSMVGGFSSPPRNHLPPFPAGFCRRCHRMLILPYLPATVPLPGTWVLFCHSGCSAVRLPPPFYRPARCLEWVLQVQFLLGRSPR